MNTTNDKIGNGHGGNGHGDDDLIRALRRMPQQIEPSRDLWSGIESAIKTSALPARPAVVATRSRLMSWPYALAAGVGCMALGGLLTLAVLRTQPVSPAQTASSAQPAAAEVGPARYADVGFSDASFGGYQSLGPEYEQARAQLAIGLAQRLERLPPQAQLKVERNLAEIRRSLREVNTALALDPDSTLLQQLLLSTYQSELAVLASVNQIAGNIPARSET